MLREGNVSREMKYQNSEALQSLRSKNRSNSAGRRCPRTANGCSGDTGIELDVNRNLQFIYANPRRGSTETVVLSTPGALRSSSASEVVELGSLVSAKHMRAMSASEESGSTRPTARTPGACFNRPSSRSWVDRSVVCEN
jgi:hypothetical protein